MKSRLYILLATALSVVLAGCQKQSFREVYPEGSPVIEASVAEPEIVYGDSLTLHVRVSDATTPLSTLQVKIIIRNRLVKESVLRTPGNEFETTMRCAIPFGAGMPDGEPIGVYLTAVNVEGTTTGSIVSTCVGHRPSVQSLYMMPPTVTYAVLGKGIEMTQESDNVFAAYQLGLPKSFKMLLAVKGNKFGRIDWDYPVFGMLDGELTMLPPETVEEIRANTSLADNYAIEVMDEKLISIDTVRFDAISFELSYSGEEAKPVTALDVQADLAEAPDYISSSSARAGYRGAKLIFSRDGVFELTGVQDIAHAVNRDWMEYAGGNQVRFLGPTGFYHISYKTAEDYIVVEPLYEQTLESDDVMWVCGVGMGQPSATPSATSGWGFDSPNQNLVCRTVSAGVYQFTAYLHNRADADHPGFGTVNFKFFHQHGWGGEESSLDYTVELPIVASNEESNVGNWWANDTEFDGIYRITLNRNDKTTRIEKIE